MRGSQAKDLTPTCGLPVVYLLRKSTASLCCLICTAADSSRKLFLEEGTLLAWQHSLVGLTPVVSDVLMVTCQSLSLPGYSKMNAITNLIMSSKHAFMERHMLSFS